MREWNLKLGDPLSLTLATDIRLNDADYCNDHIWGLSLGGGEPPALVLHTTYGLRARSLRIFPRFTEGDLTISDPAEFYRPVTINRFYPNYIRASFSPLSDIDVITEYWVPSSQVITGRLKIINRSMAARQIYLEWVSLLNPVPQGQRMAPTKIDAATVLTGQTSDLAPVMFLTGGAQIGSGPYPSLALTVDLPPQDTQLTTWVQAALPEGNASFELARQTAARNWDAECARIELTNAGQIEIHTGDPDWDAAFALTQKTAFGLFLPATEQLASPSFAHTRLPDQGYSLRGDGSDYNHLWNGQTALESYYLANLILPSDPKLAQGLLMNFLSTQTDDGFIDWKPGLGGQRSQLLATPLLASLAWRIFSFTEDQAFLAEVFPKLLAFVQSWFTSQRDRDADGIPEWDHPMQTGFDDHPVFAHWQSWAQGVNITMVESPDLCAFLYKECTTLAKIANLVGRSEAALALQALADNQKTAVEASWDQKQSSYRYWDRDSHYSPPPEVLGERQGPGKITILQEFPQPIRLLVHVHAKGEAKRQLQLFIHGTAPSGGHRVERIPSEQFRWYLETGKVTSERVYTALEHIEIQGLDEEDQVTLSCVGFTCLDQSVLLPLWAGIPGQERAKNLVRQTIVASKRFWRPYGIRACAESPDPSDEAIPCRSVHLLWNILLGEGLLKYGYRTKAAELVTNIMAAIIQTLKSEGAFHRLYNAETGQGLGERNALTGLAPLGFFLDVLGVRVLSPKRVAISGPNPFPWPVTVKYRGLTILRQKRKTMVIFPDGQNITVSNRRPVIVCEEN